MFVLNHIPLLILVGILAFILFTWANIFEKNKHFPTSLFLTYIFIIAFLTAPLRFTNFEFKNREERLKSINSDTNLSDNQKRKAIRAFDSKFKLFIFNYKIGVFSYSFFIQAFLEFVEEYNIKVKISLQGNKDVFTPTWRKDLFRYIYNH